MMTSGAVERASASPGPTPMPCGAARFMPSLAPASGSSSGGTSRSDGASGIAPPCAAPLRTLVDVGQHLRDGAYRAPAGSRRRPRRGGSSARASSGASSTRHVVRCGELADLQRDSVGALGDDARRAHAGVVVLERHRVVGRVRDDHVGRRHGGHHPLARHLALHAAHARLHAAGRLPSRAFPGAAPRATSAVPSSGATARRGRRARRSAPARRSARRAPSTRRRRATPRRTRRRSSRRLTQLAAEVPHHAAADRTEQRALDERLGELAQRARRQQVLRGPCSGSSRAKSGAIASVENTQPDISIGASSVASSTAIRSGAIASSIPRSARRAPRPSATDRTPRRGRATARARTTSALRDHRPPPANVNASAAANATAAAVSSRERATWPRSRACSRRLALPGELRS